MATVLVDVVPGLFIEVLWDIETVLKDGRREGERVVTPVWWRAEVVTTGEIDGRFKAQLRYDQRDGFESQLGEVWIFPHHVRPVDDDETQLRWRCYECSGNVSYSMENDEEAAVYRNTTSNSSLADSRSLQTLQEYVASLTYEYEQLERMVIAQNGLLGRVIGSGSSADRLCANAFTIVGQKLAVLMQRPVPAAKRRREGDGDNSFFETNCAGCISTDADCDLSTFQAIARIAKSKAPGTAFRPCFTDTQFPPAVLEHAEIVFQTLGDIADIIGITSLSDLISMAFRERCVGGTERSSTRLYCDVAIRLIATCVMNDEEEKSPTAILLGQCIHEHCLSENMTTFVRDSREFDFSARNYCQPLARKEMNGGSLLRKVFHAKLSNSDVPDETKALKDICTNLRGFTLRWQAITAPNVRMWSRSLAVPDKVNGILELEIPFVIFSGPEVVQELKEMGISSSVREEVRKQMSRIHEK